jgi:ParB family transcriptional regulator, chromosome partitioning protein
MTKLKSKQDAKNLLGATPLQLDIALIDEDKDQPRQEDNPGFSKERMAELAESIKSRGVKTPISVRENPDTPGRYLINHGARRFRASKLAGNATIPAYIDRDYTTHDQVQENLHRDSLTEREIADIIGKELARGTKKAAIAKLLNKSPAFVTQHATLLDLPEPIAEVYYSGRCKDVTIINELVMLNKKHPQEVQGWLLDETLEEITRGPVKLFREFLDEKQKQQGLGDDESMIEHDTTVSKPPADKPVDPDKLKKAIIKVQHNGRAARLQLNRRPRSEGLGWLQYDDDGHEAEANLNEVLLVAVLEGKMGDG